MSEMIIRTIDQKPSGKPHQVDWVGTPVKPHQTERRAVALRETFAKYEGASESLIVQRSLPDGRRHTASKDVRGRTQLDQWSAQAAGQHGSGMTCCEVRHSGRRVVDRKGASGFRRRYAQGRSCASIPCLALL